MSTSQSMLLSVFLRFIIKKPGPSPQLRGIYIMPQIDAIVNQKYKK